MSRLTTRKKLSHKEFEAVLDTVGLSNDYSDILNTIIVALDFQIQDMEEHGFTAAPKRMRKQATAMYDFLNKLGYYDERIEVLTDDTIRG